MKKNILVIIVIVVLLVVCGGAFYGGMVYGKNQRASSFAQGNFTGIAGSKTGANGAGFTSGDIISKDNTSITLKLPNNAGSKIIFYSNTTQVSKMAPGTQDDLINGTSVSVTGTVNSDGSITAQSIQIKPAGQDTRPNQQNPVQ